MGFGPAVSPPVPLLPYNPIEPQFHQTGQDAWLDIDVSRYVHPNAKGVVLQIINKDPSVARYVGLRKKGMTWGYKGDRRQQSMTYGIVGLNADKVFQVWNGLAQYDFWVMGFLGDEFVFLDEPVDYLPTVDMVWTDCDVGVRYPDAKAGIFVMGTGTTQPSGYGIRKKGSTDDVWSGAYHAWAIIGLDEDGYCQVKTSATGLTNGVAQLVGYITSNIKTPTNGFDVTPATIGGWTEQDVHNLMSNPLFVVINELGEGGVDNWGGRTRHSLRDIKYPPENGEWAFLFPDNARTVDLFRGIAAITFKLMAEMEKSA